jgi:hypothetical protein
VIGFVAVTATVVVTATVTAAVAVVVAVAVRAQARKRKVGQDRGQDHLTVMVNERGPDAQDPDHHRTAAAMVAAGVAAGWKGATELGAAEVAN